MCLLTCWRYGEHLRQLVVGQENRETCFTKNNCRSRGTILSFSEVSISQEDREGSQGQKGEKASFYRRGKMEGGAVLPEGVCLSVDLGGVVGLTADGDPRGKAGIYLPYFHLVPKEVHTLG